MQNMEFLFFHPNQTFDFFPHSYMIILLILSLQANVIEYVLHFSRVF